MDCHQTLAFLTTLDDTINIDEEKLKEIIDKVFSFFPQDVLDKLNQDRNLINNVDDIGWKYLHAVLYTLKTLCETELSKENPVLSVTQFRNIKTAVEVVACIGIIPSLIPEIKIHASATRSKTFKLNLDNRIFEKYKRLSYTINVLFECFYKTFFRAAFMSQMDCILAALLQLSYGPLMKPPEHISANGYSVNAEFEMTLDLYMQLTFEQNIFHHKLHDLIENCPRPILMKKLMLIMGIKKNPKWLQINIKQLLRDEIMLPNGIAALTVAICDEVSDFGKCWDKLDITAQLVATSHGPDKEKYYDSVCFEILEMLTSKNNKQGTVIAKCCIKALYDYNSDVCLKKIIHVIMEPFFVKFNNAQKHSVLIKPQAEISHCIENLCKLFLTTDAEFKCLPLKVLALVALPLFYLYVKAYKSVYVLRNQLRQLLLKVLSDETMRETIFSAFLNHQIYEHSEFGQKLCFRFTEIGGIEIASKPVPVDYEELADCLYDLVSTDGPLSFNLFTYLLKTLPILNNEEQDVQKGKLLETTADTVERIEKQLTAVKLLTFLSSKNLVQEASIKNPEPLLDFVKFFFFKIISSHKSDDKSTYEQDAGILYTSLMLIKVIVTDGNVKQSWKVFQDFTTSIRKQFDLNKIPVHVASIFEEIETIIEKKGKLYSNYCDLSADNKRLSEFDKALADLADPLLPVRAHGIIALTKLIESHHPDVAAKRDFLLCIFQENLNHDDSFIYLTAINGLCAMASMFPEKIIEILVHEFINITQETENRDIAPETRAKLGEILVKITRALGEMTPKYKSLLVNAFLCGTKDPDPLVRESSLSCLGEFCKIMGFRLGNLIIEILYCIGCIVKTDKDDGCRRAGVLVATLLLQGLGKDALIQLGDNLVPLYRSLKHLRDNDKDPVLQLHAQLALEEFDDIVQQFLFAKPKLEKSIFLLA